jgi:hypothetical protein
LGSSSSTSLELTSPLTARREWQHRRVVT